MGKNISHPKIGTEINNKEVSHAKRYRNIRNRRRSTGTAVSRDTATNVGTTPWREKPEQIVPLIQAFQEAEQSDELPPLLQPIIEELKSILVEADCMAKPITKTDGLMETADDRSGYARC
jgi:hypothetical protein